MESNYFIKISLQESVPFEKWANFMLIRDFPFPYLIHPSLDFQPNLFQDTTTFQLPSFWGTRCHALKATSEGLNYIETFPTGTHPNGGRMIDIYMDRYIH